jgi:hypothetical protein
MTRRLTIGLMFALCALAADTKSLPNQAGNAKLSLTGTVITDRKAIADLIGIDLGEGFIIVKIRAVPQTLQALRVSMDDFTLISRKNGAKSGAMSPDAIAGQATMVLQTARGSRSDIGMPAPVTRIPVGPMGIPGPGGGIGNSGSIQEGTADAKMERRTGADPRLPYLEATAFHDVETKDPVEGLLFFNLDGKLEPKHLGLIYAGPAGRLVIDFK